jgi:hypothetical protein
MRSSASSFCSRTPVATARTWTRAPRTCAGATFAADLDTIPALLDLPDFPDLPDTTTVRGGCCGTILPSSLLLALCFFSIWSTAARPAEFVTRLTAC